MICIIFFVMIFFFFQLYNFGETVSIVMWTDDWKPDSFYEKVVANKERGLHTLCLLGKESNNILAYNFTIDGLSY